MVRDRIFGSDVPFCEWMRSCKDLPSVGTDFGFVATDTDVILHRYKTSHDSIGTREVQGIMQVEIKTRSGRPSSSQTDTLTKINLFCGDRRIREVQIRHFGVFFLSMSGLNPSESQLMEWGVSPRKDYVTNADNLDWRVISYKHLIDVLRFERHPRNLADTKPFRRHHKTQELIEVEKMPLGFYVEKRTIARS